MLQKQERKKVKTEANIVEDISYHCNIKTVQSLIPLKYPKDRICESKRINGDIVLLANEQGSVNNAFNTYTLTTERMKINWENLGSNCQKGSGKPAHAVI